MTAPTAKRGLDRYEKSKTNRDIYQPIWSDVIDYMLPMFDNFYANAQSDPSNMDRIYDSAPVTGAMEFASRLVSGITPMHERWFALEPGDSVPPDERAKLAPILEEVADYIWQRITESNFSSAMQEAALNLGIGTANIAIEEGFLAERPLHFVAYGHPEIYLDLGPTREPDGIFLPMEKPWADLEVLYEGIKKPATINEIKEDEPLEVVDITTRDWTDRSTDHFYRQVIYKAGGNKEAEILLQDEIKGLGSKPIITARWSAGTSSAWGRGPFIFSLPDTKSLNYVQELIFNNAEMAISGIWQYEDDGVLNTDTIQMVPGTLVPRRKGSKGLEALSSPAQFDVAQFLLTDQRASVARGQYNRQFSPVGRTPLSATETNEKQIDLIETIGLSIVNLIRELALPIVMRSAHILRKKGLIDLPNLNGREVKIRAISPLAKALQQGRIVEMTNFLSVVQGLFGPEQMAVFINTEKAIQQLAEWHNVPKGNLRTKAQQREFVQQVTQAANAAQQPPEAA